MYCVVLARYPTASSLSGTFQTVADRFRSLPCVGHFERGIAILKLRLVQHPTNGPSPPRSFQCPLTRPCNTQRRFPQPVHSLADPSRVSQEMPSLREPSGIALSPPVA